MHPVTEIHEIAAKAILTIAIFRAAGALIHHFAFGDNTLIRMLPRRTARTQQSHGG